MTTSTELACRTCKKRLWVGQSNYIYIGREHLDVLRDFLQEHRTGSWNDPEHELVFTDEHNDEVMEYESDPRAYV